MTTAELETDWLELHKLFIFYYTARDTTRKKTTKAQLTVINVQFSTFFFCFLVMEIVDSGGRRDVFCSFF